MNGIVDHESVHSKSSLLCMVRVGTQQGLLYTPSNANLRRKPGVESETCAADFGTSGGEGELCLKDKYSPSKLDQPFPVPHLYSFSLGAMTYAC